MVIVKSAIMALKSFDWHIPKPSNCLVFFKIIQLYTNFSRHWKI